MNQHKRERKREIAIYGHFNSTNFGNESTLQAILYHLRRLYPDAKFTCICTRAETSIVTHQMETILLSENFLKSWVPRNAFARVLRRVCVGLASEPLQWVRGFMKLSQTDVLIVPGTGVLTDAYGLLGWGPYNLLKWTLLAKACRCKLFFVSVGAGPIYGTLGRLFVKLALSLSDFRSYRDESTVRYLKGIGFDSDKYRVYPDLVFSLPEEMIPDEHTNRNGRTVVGLGLMEYQWKYSVDKPLDAIYHAYLENLVAVVKWLLSREYDVRLLSGDLRDANAIHDFKALLRERLSISDQSHIIAEPICSVDAILSQITATDVVVATRFHNIVMALVCNKPVISISFHHKCDSLMNAMGLAEYCLDINNLRADSLIKKISDVEKNADKIKVLISEKTRAARAALDEQYKLFSTIM
jgi:polysaccharide pyruvyl transferase WcaK-like protein